MHSVEMKSALFVLLAILAVGCQTTESPKVVQSAPIAETPKPKIEESKVVDTLSLGLQGEPIAGRLPLAALKAADDVIYDATTGLYFLSMPGPRLAAVDREGTEAFATDLPEGSGYASFFGSRAGTTVIGVYAANRVASLWKADVGERAFVEDANTKVFTTPDEAIDSKEMVKRRALLKEIAPRFHIPPPQMPPPGGPTGSPRDTRPDDWYDKYPVLTGRPDLPRVDFSRDGALMVMANADALVARRSGKTWRKDLLRPGIAGSAGVDKSEIVPTEVQIRGGVIAFGFHIASRPDVQRTALCRAVNNGFDIEIVKARFVRAL